MHADAPRPTPTTGGLDDLYDIGRLAARLGVEHSTIRVWLSRKVPWLPLPDGRLNGGAVWRATTLEGIEERRTPGRPGRKRSFAPAAVAADVARTGPIPVVRATTGAIPLATKTAAVPVATTTGAIAAAVTGAVPLATGGTAVAATTGAMAGAAAGPAAAATGGPTTLGTAPGPVASVVSVVTGAVPLVGDTTTAG